MGGPRSSEMPAPTDTELALANDALPKGTPSSRHHHLHALSLLPPPSDDPKDPLRWPTWIKIAALISAALTNFTANFAGTGLSLAAQVLAMQYHQSASGVNKLFSFNLLFLGIGNLVWVPLGVKFGKRFALLTSCAMHFAVLVWTAKIDGFNALLAARCLTGLAGGAGESVVPGIVSDIFFLHERAAMMSGYTILASGATAAGPLVGALMVQYSPGGYVDYMWLSAALAGFNLLLLFFFYPESNFHRPDAVDGQRTPPAVPRPASSESKPTALYQESADHGESGLQLGQQNATYVVEKKLTSIWTSFVTVDRSVSFFRVCLRPLVLLLCPDVLFATLLYGIALASQLILIFAFPQLLLAPPYLFTPVQVGLMQVAAIIGFIIACFAGGYLADAITARMIIRHNGRVFPEQRLVALIPGFAIAPIGCIIIAVACSHQLSWVAIAFGFGMASFGTVYAPNIAITYVVESRPHQASESIVAINVFKNLVSFLFLYVAVDWVATRGWLEVYMIIFMLVTLSMLMAVPFYFFGSRMKAMSSKLERFL